MRKLGNCTDVHQQLTNSKFCTVPMFVTIFYILSGPGVGMYLISNLIRQRPMVHYSYRRKTKERQNVRTAALQLAVLCTFY